MAPPKRKRVCGIYRIQCHNTGYVYIGSSIDVYKREKHYWKVLSKGACHNKVLQFAWNIFGGQSFSFHIVETCAKDQLSEREKYFISLAGPKLFNILMDGRRLPEMTVEQRDKLSERTKQQHRDKILGKAQLENR